jgi:hypothetical protein
MQKLVENSKNLETECEKVEQSSQGQDNVRKDTATTSTHKFTKQRSDIRFTPDEDNYIRLSIEKFGLRWSMILHHPEFNFNACCVPNTLERGLKCDCKPLNCILKRKA